LELGMKNLRHDPCNLPGRRRNAMNGPKPGLMTKGHPERRMPPMGPSLLWAFLCLVMWFWAIAGPLCVLLAVASSFVDLSDVIEFPGREAEALSVGIVLGAVGISFVWLRMRGYVKFCRE
jgi:hypothetical protein